MEDSIVASEWNNDSAAPASVDVFNESVTSVHPIQYPREASYFAAACAILFVLIGIGGKGKKNKINYRISLL